VYLDFGRAPLDNTSGRVSVRTVMQINLSASEFGAATTRKVLSHDLLSATLRYADSGRTMTAPLVQGMPYVTVEYAGGLRPKLAAGLDESPPGPAFRLTIASVNGSATPATVTGTKFKLVMSDGSTWLLYASSSISFNWNHGEMVAASAFAGTLRVANLPAPAAEAVLDSHATVIPLGGEPTVGVGCDVATLRFVYRTNVAGPLLIAAMPHHLARMVSPAVTALTYGSLSGTLTGVEAPTFSGASTLTMRLPLPSITWSAPRPIAPAHEAAVRAALAIDKTFVPPPNVDTHPYWAGKQLAKMARLALIADDLQDAATAAALRSRLRTLLSTWLTGDNGNPFVYDTTWGGVVTTTSILDPGAEFGQGRYNDHHFHYGYFLYAAAVVAKGDPEFATLYRPGILALVRDIANPSGRDPKFPRFRHMDFFRGHSWARGLDVAIDQNQESTSEAVNAWHGMQLLGLALGDSRMSDIGRLLLALELDGARTYWQIPSASTIYQDPFKQNMCVGRLLATAASFDTFFGGAAPQFVYGIQMLPYTPVSEALLSPAWVGDAWTKMATAAAGADQQWAGLLYMAHATVAREAAWSEVFPLTAWDDGNSQTNTFWWVATRP
jgi:endo-1,3(4)-beta-glucanase